MLDVNNLALEQVMVVVSGILCFWQAILIVPSSYYNWFTEATAGFCLREGSVCVSCVLSKFLPRPSYQLARIPQIKMSDNFTDYSYN